MALWSGNWGQNHLFQHLEPLPRPWGLQDTFKQLVSCMCIMLVLDTVKSSWCNCSVRMNQDRIFFSCPVQFQALTKAHFMQHEKTMTEAFIAFPPYRLSDQHSTAMQFFTRSRERYGKMSTSNASDPTSPKDPVWVSSLDAFPQISAMTCEGSEFPDSFPPVHLELILQFLLVGEIQELRSSRSLSQDAKPYLKRRCHAFLQKLVPYAAQLHYQQLFNSSDENQLLCMRQLLVNVDESTQFGQWRTQTAVARLMTGVSMDGTDLFAAVKRAFLASQVPVLAKNEHVVLWMHVLGALEEQDPIQSKLLAAEAWEALASQLGENDDRSFETKENRSKNTLNSMEDIQYKQENNSWPAKDPLDAIKLLPSSLLLCVQTAHFVNAMDHLETWLCHESGPSTGQLYHWLKLLEEQLEMAPTLGRYGPSGDSSQLRSRHVAKIHERISQQLWSQWALFLGRGGF